MEYYGARGNGATKRKSLKEGTYGSGGEILQHTYYDSYALLVATTVTRLFTTGLAGGRRLDQTNMQIGGQLPANEKHTVHALKAFYCTYTEKTNAGLLAWFKYLTHTVVEVIINGKAPSLVVGLDELFGMTTKLMHKPTVAGDNIIIPEPKYSGIFPVRPSIVLASNTVIEVKVSSFIASDTLLDTDILKIGLAGILERRT